MNDDNLRTMSVFSVAVATIVTLLIGVADWATGHEISFFIFYFFPIAFVARANGVPTGLLISVIAGVIWFVANNVLVDPHLSSPFYGYWNAAARLAAFSFVAVMVGGAPAHRMREKSLQDQLRSAERQLRRVNALLPICSACDAPRTDAEYMKEVGRYMRDYAGPSLEENRCVACARKATSEVDGEMDEELA